jgi:hypothetical protein
MQVDGAVMTMARKRKGKTPEPEKLHVIASVKVTNAFEQWIDELVAHSHLVTRATLIKNALRIYAEHIGFEKPQPRR